MVYVLNKDGKPLMPSIRHGKIRRMLKEKKAVVVKTTPFTVKLLYTPKTNVIQNLVLGIDPGSRTLSTVVRVEKTPKLVYVSEVKVRTDITSKLKKRSSYRKTRRNRKTRYRESRFLNRKRKEKWLPPSVVSKLNSHKKEIKFIFNILPVSRVILERNTFDTHKLKNPSISGKGYKHGTLYSYENHRQYVLTRDKYCCRSCKKKNVVLNTHHITFKSKGGKDHYSNLVTLCETCHKKVHSGKLKLHKKLLASLGTSVNTLDATHATIISKRLEEFLLKHKDRRNYKFLTTFGYETVVKRRILKLKKTHYNDAISISYPIKTSYSKTRAEFMFRKISVSKGDYQQTKGVRSQVKIPTCKIHGFRKFDIVQYLGKYYIIKGRMSSGYAILMNSKLKPVNFGTNGKSKPTVNFKLLKRISSRRSTLIIEVRKH